MKKYFKFFMIAIIVFILSSTIAYSFTDINNANVNFLVKKGILSGYEDGSFKPEKLISRAEFSTVMCRALGLVDYAQSLKGEQMFFDVPTVHWACGYVNALAKKGIINGTGNGNFDPESTVTHAQVSKIIASAIGYTNEDASHYGGYPVGWQKIADIVGFSVAKNEEEINAPISRIGVVNSICQSGIVYKEPVVIATVEDLKKGDKEFLKTVERLDIGMADALPYNWHLLGLSNLKEVTCSPENTVYCVVDGVLYNKRMDHLALYPASKPGKSFVVPDSVNGIWPGAFYNCKYLTELTFGQNVRMICEDAFSGCKFRTLKLPTYISTIDKGAFANCKYLEEIDISSEYISGFRTSNVFEGGNKDLKIYSSLDPYGSVFEFASKYGYTFNGEKPNYMPENIHGIYIGISYEDAKNTLKEFDVLPTRTNDKWIVYGSYENFTAVYFKENKADFIFTTDFSQMSEKTSPFVDPLGPQDWGLGMGTLPPLTADESNEIMIGHFVNAYRAVYGLPPLEYDKDLADISRYHSENMSKARILDHNLNGESPSDRLRKFNYNYTSYVENIAQNPYWITQAVSGWIASEGHRKNFLTKGVTKMGVGISQENRFYTWMGATGGLVTKTEPEEPEKAEKYEEPAKNEPDLSSIVTGERIPDGTYVIATKLDPTYALDIYGGYKDNGTNLQLWHRNNTAAQNFEVTYIGNGYYTIINQNSGKAIDAQNGNTAPGTNVWQYTVNNTDAQIWKIVPAEDNNYYIINKGSDLYLDVNLAIAADGTNVKLYVRNDAYDAQKWYFIKK